MAVAGKNCLIRITGQPVAFSSEATATSDDKVYVLASTSLAGLPWDPTATVSVRVGGNPTTEAIVNRLAGTVEFSTADTRTVTVTGEYLPISTVGEAKEFGLTLTATNQEAPAFGDDYVTRTQTLKDVTGSLGAWYADKSLINVVGATSVANPVVLEFFVASTSAYHARAWALFNSDEISASADGLVEESIDWEGAPDADERVIDFQ